MPKIVTNNQYSLCWYAAQVHVQNRNLPLSDDVSVESVAAATTGFTGADLANLVNEAALLAGRANNNKVTQCEFDAAILRAVVGIEKKRSLVKGLEKDVVSKHEVSSFVCALENTGKSPRTCF